MKMQNYNRFWQNIHQAARKKGFPLRVMFELTYRCNFSCPHCYIPQSYRKRGELRTKEVFLILEQLKDIGCFYLGLTGGELFMRRDIIKILGYAKRCGFEVIIYTNGSLLDEKLVKELIQFRINKVDITIPAMNKVNFERISGVVGSRDKVFKAIGLLRKNKVALGFKTCVLKENQKEIKEIKAFASSQGTLHRLDDVLSRQLDGSAEPFRYRGSLEPDLFLNQRETEECALTINKERYRSANCNLSAINLFKCAVGQTQAAITPQGELKTCLMIDYPKYKILDTSLRDCWGKLKSFISKIKPDRNYKCNKCSFEIYCKWCPGQAWLYNRSFTSCVPENRKKAKLIKSLAR